MKSSPPLRAAILVALALVSFSSNAQQSKHNEIDETAPDPVDLDTIQVTGRALRLYKADQTSTATRTATPLELVPQSVQVITRELIEDQAAREVTDLYRNISGISFFSYAGVTLRGFRQENVLFDGLRGDPYAGFSVPRLFNIQRVEVLKGPAGAVYGSGDPGGVINYVTKKPTASQQGRVTLQAGNFDYRAASIESSGPIDEAGRVRYRVGMHAGSEEPFRFNTDRETRIGDASLEMDVGDTGQWLVQYTDLSQELAANRLRGVPVNDAGVFLTDIGWNHNEPTDFLNMDASVALTRLTFSPASNLDVDLAALWFENAEQQQYHEPRGLADDGRTMRREFRDQSRSVKGLTLNANAVLRFDTGGLRHTLLGGVETFTVESDFRGRSADSVAIGGPVPGLDLFDPVYGLTSAAAYGLDGIPFRISRSRSQRDGVYLQDQIEVGQRWHVLAGLRWDRFEDEDRIANTSVEGEDTSWRLGTTFEATETVNVYGSVASGFVPQSAGSQSPLAGGPFDPETSRQWEIGAKTTLADGRVSLNGALYRIERSNILQATGMDPGNDGVDDLIALGLVRSQGVEIDLLADLTERWVLSAVYAYNDARVIEGSPAAAGNTAGDGSDRFANAPRHQFGLWTRYDLPAIDSAVSFGANHIGERVSLDGQAVKAYTIFDVSWQTQLGDWMLQANIKNLFDKVYAASGFIERTGHFPGEPRRLYLQARYSF